MKKAFLVGLCSISTLSLFGCADSAPEYVGDRNLVGDFKISQYPNNALVKASGSMVQYTVSGLPRNAQNSLCINVGKETVCDDHKDTRGNYYFTFPTDNDPNAYIVVPVSFINENSISDNKVDNGELNTNINVTYFNGEKYATSNTITKVNFENPRSYLFDNKNGFQNNNGQDSIKVTLRKNVNPIYKFTNKKNSLGYIEVLDYDNSIDANSIKVVNSENINNFKITSNQAASKDSELTFTINRESGIRGDAIVSVPMNNKKDTMQFIIPNEYRSHIIIKDVDEKISSNSEYLVKEIIGTTTKVVLQCYSPAEHCKNLVIGRITKENVAQLMGISKADLEKVPNKTFKINVTEPISNDEYRITEQLIVNFNNIDTYSRILLKKGNVNISSKTGFTISKKSFAGEHFTLQSEVKHTEPLGLYTVKQLDVSKEPVLTRSGADIPDDQVYVELENGSRNSYLEIIDERNCLNRFNVNKCEFNIRPLQASINNNKPLTTKLLITGGDNKVKKEYSIKVTGPDDVLEEEP